MAGDDVRQVFEALLPQEEIECPSVQFGVMKRQRQLNLGMLVQAWVIAAGIPSTACQANALRSSVEFKVPRVTCSACYGWFDEPLERCMEALVDRRLKSAPQFDAVDAEPPFCAITPLHAPLVASIIAALLACACHMEARPQQSGAPWTKAPLLLRRPALQFSVSGQFIAQTFDLKRAEAERRWEKMAELLTYTGRDANWRRPSGLDQLRGWKRQSAVRNNASDRNVQTAA